MGFLDYIDKYMTDDVPPVQVESKKVVVKKVVAKPITKKTKKFSIPKKVVNEKVEIINHAVEILEGINESIEHNEHNEHKKINNIAEEMTNHASSIL